MSVAVWFAVHSHSSRQIADCGMVSSLWDAHCSVHCVMSQSDHCPMTLTHEQLQLSHRQFELKSACGCCLHIFLFLCAACVCVCVCVFVCICMSCTRLWCVCCLCQGVDFFLSLHPVNTKGTRGLASWTRCVCVCTSLCAV